MHRNARRLVAASCLAALIGGCTVTRQQRRYAVLGGAAFTAGSAIYAFSRFLAHCPDHATIEDDRNCEADRIDDRNQWAGIALIGLVATIGLQLLPVSDPEKPAPTPLVVAPPPPPPAHATALHDPVAVQLADQARALAAAGKCVEAFGSLHALDRVDRPLADQLRAWDPTVSRCRRQSQSRGSETAVAVPAPTPAPIPAGPGATPPSPPQ